MRSVSAAYEARKTLRLDGCVQSWGISLVGDDHLRIEKEMARR